MRDEELRNFYQASTASFNPSSYEGFGLPILEAMACGTPAVTCRNSSLPEVGGDAALYLDEPVRDSLINMMILFEKNNCLCLIFASKASNSLQNLRGRKRHSKLYPHISELSILIPKLIKVPWIFQS